MDIFKDPYSQKRMAGLLRGGPGARDIAMPLLDPEKYLHHFDGLEGSDEAKREAAQSLIDFANRVAEQYFGTDPVSLAFDAASNSRAPSLAPMLKSNPKPPQPDFTRAARSDGPQKGKPWRIEPQVQPQKTPLQP